MQVSITNARHAVRYDSAIEIQFLALAPLGSQLLAALAPFLLLLVAETAAFVTASLLLFEALLRLATLRLEVAYQAANTTCEQLGRWPVRPIGISLRGSLALILILVLVVVIVIVVVIICNLYRH